MPSFFTQDKQRIQLRKIIIHHTHYQESDWSRAFNQFTIACELDMINAISAADIAFINVCLVTKPLGVFSSETKWLNASLLFLRMNYMCKCIIKQLLNSVFGFFSCQCYLPQPSASADNTDLGFDNS